MDKSKIIKIIIFIIIINLYGCEGNENKNVVETQSNEILVGEESKEIFSASDGGNNGYEQDNITVDYKIYNSILSDVEDYVDIYSSADNIHPIGKVKYFCYQLYDIDKNGIDELFICRKSAYGKDYIDSAYTIKNGKPVLFTLFDNTELKTIYKIGATIDEVFYPILGGKILKVIYHDECVRKFMIYDFDEYSIDDYYEKAYETWGRNGNSISTSIVYDDLSSLLSEICLFNGVFYFTKTISD